MSITAVVVDTDDLFAIDVEFGAAPEATVEVNWPSIEIGVPGLTPDLSGFVAKTGDTMSGALGIGLPTGTEPYDLFHVHNSENDMYGNGRYLEFDGISDTVHGEVTFFRTRAGGANVAAGDILGRFSFIGMDGTSYPTTATFQAIVSGPVSANTVPADIVLSTSSIAPAVERLRITNAGRTILSGPLTLSPLSSETPTVNGQLSFEATSNTQLKLKYKGSDGVVRSATLTLA